MTAKASGAASKSSAANTSFPGNIILRQCGTKWQPGRNVGLGRDYTIFALIEGHVFFDREGRRVNVKPAELAVAT